MMGIDTLISLVYDNLDFYEKLIFVLIFLTIIFSSFIFFQNNKFMKKLKFFYITYWVGLIIFVVAIFLKILAINLILFSENFFYIPLYISYFLLFIISPILPLSIYGKGLNIFIENQLVIPITGERLEIRFINKTPLDEEITFVLNLPDNIIIKDGSRKIEKTFRLKGKSRILIPKKVFPSKKNLERITFININSPLFGNVQKKIIFKT